MHQAAHGAVGHGRPLRSDEIEELPVGHSLGISPGFGVFKYYCYPAYVEWGDASGGKQASHGITVNVSGAKFGT